jgi:hypothetical protein
VRQAELAKEGINMSASKKSKCEERGCIHKVVIYKEGCKYRVEPGRLVVHPRALVRFVSLVPDFEIMFPEAVRAVAQENSKQEKNRKKTLFVINADLGSYPYSVYVPAEGGGDLAEGGSSPRIIVADP